nr:type II toxin-antitoxin system YoeB family toxin [uncultured Fibrobacter sp.]
MNQLVKDIERNHFEGIGKPEALKGNLSGFWSRRIDDGSFTESTASLSTFFLAKVTTKTYNINLQSKFTE